nr:variable large family protein [Borrelia persica]
MLILLVMLLNSRMPKLADISAVNKTLSTLIIGIRDTVDSGLKKI